MKKDTFYFSHDHNSRSDEKIKKLIRKHGMLGYGIFWALVEDLYNNANSLQLDCDGIAYDYREDPDMIYSIINDFDLFVISNDNFGSTSIENRLIERDNKTVKARESAYKRWNKDANALPTHCESTIITSEGNAIYKGNKGKDIKGNILINNWNLFENVDAIKEKIGDKYLKYDIEYYYEAMKSWSQSKGELKKDWLATLRYFINRDEKESKGKLKNNKTTKLVL